MAISLHRLHSPWSLQSYFPHRRTTKYIEYIDANLRDYFVYDGVSFFCFCCFYFKQQIYLIYTIILFMLPAYEYNFFLFEIWPFIWTERNRRLLKSVQKCIICQRCKSFEMIVFEHVPNVNQMKFLLNNVFETEHHTHTPNVYVGWWQCSVWSWA